MTTEATIKRLQDFGTTCGAGIAWLQSEKPESDSDTLWKACPRGDWLFFRLKRDPALLSAPSSTLELIVAAAADCSLIAIADAFEGKERTELEAIATAVRDGKAGAADAQVKHARLDTDAGRVLQGLGNLLEAARAFEGGTAKDVLHNAYLVTVRGGVETSLVQQAKFARAILARIPKLTALQVTKL